MTVTLGIFAKTYEREDVGAVLRAVRADGFAAVQFNLVSAGLPTLPDRVPPDLPARLRTALRQEGLRPAALSGTYNLIDPDPAARRQSRDRLLALIAAAPTLGFDLVTLCTGTRDPHGMWTAHPDNKTRGAWSELRAELDVLLTAAEEAGVTLGIEPEFANVVATPSDAARLIAETGTPHLCVVLDPANLEERPTRRTSRAAIDRAMDDVGAHLGLAHAKDRAPDGSERPAGQGAVDFPHYLVALRQAGYAGTLVMHGLSEAAVSEARAHLIQAADVAGLTLATHAP